MNEYMSIVNPEEQAAPCPPPLKLTLMDIAGVQEKTLEMLDCILRFIGEEGKIDTADAPKSFGDELRVAHLRQKLIADKTMRIASLLGVEL